jgi:hypothetical protein
MDPRPDLADSVRYAPGPVVTVALVLLAWALIAIVLALVLAQLMAADAEPSVGPWQRIGSASPSVTDTAAAVPAPRASADERRPQPTAG